MLVAQFVYKFIFRSHLFVSLTAGRISHLERFEVDIQAHVNLRGHSTNTCSVSIVTGSRFPKLLMLLAIPTAQLS